MSNTVAVKISIANNTRRLNVNRQTTFDQFKEQVTNLFEVSQNLDWSYLDEENDTVTFSTSQEWSDALQIWPDGKLLKLNATLVQPQAAVNPQTVTQNAPAPPTQSRCCSSSFATRVLLPFGLLYSVFTHPFLTLIGLATLMYVTYHHYPEQHEKLKTHAKAHWRKVAVAFALRMLFCCKLCTLFFLIPIGIFAYRRLRAHCESQAFRSNCCNFGTNYFIKARQFLDSHQIKHVDDLCKFACALFQGKKCPARAELVQEPVVRAQSVQERESKVPSAPVYNEIYPQPVETVTLPERVERAQYFGELEALSLMGFDNKKLNEHLLRNFNGDLDRVINSLLQLSTMK